MTSNARCWRRRLAFLAIAMLSLAACATASSDNPSGACPPVVEYGRAEPAHAAEEVDALPDGVAILEWLADYAVLRDQARACRTATATR